MRAGGFYFYFLLKPFYVYLFNCTYSQQRSQKTLNAGMKKAMYAGMRN